MTIPDPDALSTREAARIQLVRSVPKDSADLEATFTAALRIAAHALGVDRVGIWTGVDGWRSMRAELVLDARTDTLTRGTCIDLTAAPTYATALLSRRMITAHDAQHDAVTRELNDYLVENDIRSMLDCPIFEHGELFGVVCHEVVGISRTWTKADADFATSVSDMIGLYLAQHSAKVTAERLVATRDVLDRARVMESLGRMAAGVAHDFNNVLAAIGLSAERLARVSEAGSAGARAAGEVLPLVDQGSRMVSHLLSFAQRGPAPMSVVDLGMVLREGRAVVEPLSRDGIAVTITVPDGPVNVRIERSLFEQVVMNLVVNSRDAMLGGGRLALSLTSDEAAREAVFRVSDTGVGFDEKTRERIFEPFFSTKSSHGSGLGLATVYGIVRDAGGRIDVESTVGAGTEFAIHLPLA